MHPTVRALLAEPSLRLTLLGAGDDQAIDAPVSWAHGSDLPDPTPFLDAGQILLTTGTQFLSGDADPAGYVSRLARAGVAALGFGTEVATAGTPPDLIAACAAVGLPLFEVPYEIPFIAIARSIADRVAAAEHARDAWALGAMRAIAFAALKPDGLAATVDELERVLDRTVLLFDARAEVTHGSRASERVDETGTNDAVDAVVAEARRLLSRGQRSSSTLHPGGQTAVLQTIGRRAELRGVLAVIGRADLDASDQTVVTSVVALVGLALEQGREVSRARAGVRAAAARVLLDGRADLADVVLDELGERTPAGELVVAHLRVVGRRPHGETTPSIPTPVEGGDARVLVASLGDDVVVIGPVSGVEATIEQIRSAQDDPGAVRAGLSTVATRDDLARADREARAALDAASSAEPRVRAADLTTRGVDWLLDRPGSRELASAVLRPLSEDPVLLESLEAWLVANGQTDPAARRLGVHRHTLRARISTIERLIGRDLSGVEARTEAWIALRAIRSSD
ncbi:purine catabolism regulator [Labedella gwakjiensis]|uniref:PucR family transcriptional regulator n=1 Tax=Labedella gwakjiensis TaxID=390269 RepID=A0A2P8GSV5_9MICO|nr:PucR family transcriptional regulator [Labedella gwakjiensis]PSL37043.1 purine catabolism regulator [Labedella gwakjiensis]RUQ82045.1 PucR family transcriptional regulator [Labedella gwakjiensis]